MYTYIQTEPKLYTVGIYTGEIWEPESDHATREEAAARVNYLNGGSKNNIEDLYDAVKLKNKLTLVEFGLNQIIDLCHANIELYEAADKNGTAVAKILGQVLALRTEINKVDS